MCVGDISPDGKPGCYRRATKVVVGLVVLGEHKGEIRGGVGLATVCERHLAAMVDFMSDHEEPVILPIKALPGVREQLGDDVWEMSA